ncbi:hypothetical protein QTP86_013331, partial [Hemibagrus guttatus]
GALVAQWLAYHVEGPAQRHQFQTAHSLLMCQLAKPILEVTDVSTLHIDVINQDIALAVKQKHPEIISVNLAKNVTYNSFNYNIGMVVAHGSLAGLPEFCEIVHMIVLHKSYFHCQKTGCMLEKGNAAYKANMTRLTLSSKMKSDILEKADVHTLLCAVSTGFKSLDVNLRQECLLKCLTVYLGEDDGQLIKDYLDRYIAQTGVTGALPWSQAWGWGTQASAWWPSLCLRDSAGHSPKKRRRPTFP